MKGLKEVVVSRQAPCAFGTSHSSIFREGVHKNTHKYYDSFEGKDMCRNCASWFVARGDKLDANKPISHEFYRIIPLAARLVFEDQIYESFADVAPDYSDENCKVLGVLKTDLSKVPRWKFDKITGQNGQDCYRIDYTLLATFGSADITIKFEMKGTTYSDVHLDYADSTAPKKFFSLARKQD